MIFMQKLVKKPTNSMVFLKVQNKKRREKDQMIRNKLSQRRWVDQIVMCMQATKKSNRLIKICMVDSSRQEHLHLETKDML